MRFFRCTAIAAMLLAFVVLGSACAGAKGEQGPQGDQGIQGIQGERGPNMIVAMGNIKEDGTIYEGYNVTSVTLDGGYYVITLTGITYTSSSYVTVVTPSTYLMYHFYTEADGKLLVGMRTGGFAFVPCSFSFMVLECP